MSNHLLNSTYGRVWAVEFCKAFERAHGVSIDEESVFIWFANALETGIKYGREMGRLNHLLHSKVGNYPVQEWSAEGNKITAPWTTCIRSVEEVREITGLPPITQQTTDKLELSSVREDTQPLTNEIGIPMLPRKVDRATDKEIEEQREALRKAGYTSGSRETHQLVDGVSLMSTHCAIAAFKDQVLDVLIQGVGVPSHLMGDVGSGEAGEHVGIPEPVVCHFEGMECDAPVVVDNEERDR